MGMGKCIVVKLRQAGYERVLDFVATEDAKLDVGTISRSFGLNPSSVKFNNIYVSRGPDFISSVTWSNLLGCFVKKGYSTGNSEQDPILVDGKPCEPNALSTHDRDVNSREIYNHSQQFQGGNIYYNKRSHLEDAAEMDVVKKKTRFQCDSDVDFKSHLQQNEQQIVQNSGDSLNLNCNMELKKRTRSDEMLTFSPCKRAR